ncbi:hypothetical protein Bca101_015210 [Brassica carinata]
MDHLIDNEGSERDNELAGVIGASGGPYIFPAVIQVFLNHFIFKMSPLEAVQSPRVYPKLKPNTVLYEDMTVYNGDHIKLKEETREFLKARGHELVVTRFTFARQFTGEESETKSNDKDFVVTSKNGVVAFGSGFMSTSTGVILNNQMADFSIPTEESAAPANYIKANKRPLSSMMPLIITRVI